MHFVIAGRTTCPQFTYAVMVAQRLKENLPEFTYLKIPKQPQDWDRWLVQTCKENEWYHTLSPLIWREFGLKMGKKQFIGNINKFLDLCYDYYGIPRGVLAADEFKKQEMNWFKKRTEDEYFEGVKLDAKAKQEFKSRQICITGASSQITEILVMEILKIQQQCREGGLEIRLFDEPRKESKLMGSAFDAKYCPGLSGFGNCRVATTLKEALLNVDLVIVLDAFSRKPKESLVKWLKRNRNAMCALGKGLDMYANVHCRVIIGSPSTQPICYNATVLASFATKLHVRNIVVVTQDLGREMLKSISTRTNVPLKDLYCPPVWGFIGLNKYIDVCKTLQTYVYKVPGKRQDSTLPQGTEEFELRTLDRLISEEDTGDMHVNVSNLKAESFPQLGRWPCLAKATAIIDLLKVWGLKQEDGNGEILCLGVYSDGTFNIPHGLYWSQPVILRNGFWVPFPDYPIPRTYHFNCYYLFIFGLASLYRTKVKPRRYVSPKRIANTKKKKFDINKIIEKIQIPMIRTDSESVNYLKYLVKNELGIDFSVFEIKLEEESDAEVIAPPEIVIREELFCECWRQELKELQKILFYHPSSSEVEIDLEENVSGSEWSVINTNLAVTPEVTSPIKVLESQFSRPSAKSSVSTVCSCGALSNDSICRCLAKEKLQEVESTGHFYKEQNVQVYQDDLKDAIYEDTYVDGKRVKFDPKEKADDKASQIPRQFYGRKDAIRDETTDWKMKRRIIKYERGSIESLEGENFEQDESVIDSKERLNVDESKEPKFHISIEGTPYDIIGDQNGLENLEMRRTEANSPSLKSFREMYTDKVSPQLQVIPPPLDKSDTLSVSHLSLAAESSTEKSHIYAFENELFDGEDHSLVSLDGALDAIYDRKIVNEEDKDKKDEVAEESEENGEYAEGPFRFQYGETESIEQEEKTIKPPKIPRWKMEGVSLCCLCRCLLPEGLPCCPCGNTTVVEVFKKESVEVIVQSEDDMSYKIEYTERFIEPESISSIPELPEKEDIVIKDLPPESFFPFSPKLPNEFKQENRPKELTKEYLTSLRKEPERQIPQKCVEFLEIAKIKLKEETAKKESRFAKFSEEVQERFYETCTMEEPPIKTDFSNLDLFVPDGIEDWQFTVQMKYRNWFYQGSDIRDESYYDVAVEEISEDEFEFDKELEIYFEM